MVPTTRPRQTRDETERLVRAAGVTDAVVLLGVRGYYRDTMGVRGVNDRGIYDDAIFVLSPDVHASYNANTDPSRWGMNRSLGKPYAQLQPGVWRYRVGRHKWRSPSGYTALIQAADVTVARYRSAVDAQPLIETGPFGINIHRGSAGSTSSEGCQTIPPAQWEPFLALVRGEMARHRQTTIPYVLLEGPTR